MTDPNKTYSLVIVTDLDGSLLDHHTYSHTAADGMLRRLDEQHTPVILCTSKTCAEVEQLRLQLDNRHPFIVENGAAVFIPQRYFDQQPADTIVRGDYWVREFCPPRQHWIDLLQQAREKFGDLFENFASMDTARVAELTGLSLEHAARAQVRGYGEPLRWFGDSDELKCFSDWFEDRGARVLRGGRFVHVAGPSDKGRGLQWLAQRFQQHEPSVDIVTMALGDGHNDVDMLRCADLAVVIRSPVHEPPTVDGQPNVYTTSGHGPIGWVEGVEYWLHQLDQIPNSIITKHR